MTSMATPDTLTALCDVCLTWYAEFAGTPEDVVEVSARLSPYLFLLSG